MTISNKFSSGSNWILCDPWENVKIWISLCLTFVIFCHFMSITNRIYVLLFFSHLGFLPSHMDETKFFQYFYECINLSINSWWTKCVQRVWLCRCTFYFFALVHENLINRDDYLLQFSFSSLDKAKPPKSANTVFCTVCDTITVLNTPTRAVYEFCSVFICLKANPASQKNPTMSWFLCTNNWFIPNSQHIFSLGRPKLSSPLIRFHQEIWIVVMVMCLFSTCASKFSYM